MQAVDIFNLYGDDDNESLSFNADDNDRSGIYDKEDFIEEENNTPSSFSEDYARSTQHIREIMNMLFSRSMWSGRPKVTHTPAYMPAIAVVLKTLRTISPVIDENLKVDSPNIKKFL